MDHPVLDIVVPDRIFNGTQSLPVWDFGEYTRREVQLGSQYMREGLTIPVAL